MKNQYEPEQQLVIDMFQKSFLSQKKQKIVLYGIGKNTEAVLFGTKGYQFAGLMDQNTTGKVIYNHKVLSDLEVIELHPIIVIIARQSAINIIFKRIQYLYTKYGIPIYDFQGKLLGQESLYYQNEDLPYWKASEEELIKKIKEHDIISFDIFDTLLMRKILQPEDIFQLIEIYLDKEGYCYPFKEMRLKAEHRIEKNCPNLDEIYKKMQEIYDLDVSVTAYMQEIEYKIDSSLLLRREKMYKIFCLALSEGKDVYLLSDMYYPKKYLEELLLKNGITGYKELLVSCDLKKRKSDGSMYQWFLLHVENGKKLHIGDNRRVDIEKAEEYGIDTYQIYSAYELLMASTLQDILVNIDTIQKRCILGLIISKLFNDPFILCSSKGYLCISDIQKVGYCFIAPILMEFMKWFLMKIKEYKIEQVLFPSRDGYLMKKIYDLIKVQDKEEAIYFRTSRRAVCVAAIKNESDIQRIASRKYYGTYAKYLKSRFGIEMRENDLYKEIVMKEMNDKITQEVLKSYEKDILENAEIERKEYLKYLDRGGILVNKKQALFDFIAGGTVQYNLIKLLGHDVLGIYFATMNLPNDLYKEDTKEIITSYGNIQSYGFLNNLGKYYLFIEAVLVDERGSFSHIDSEGKEVFVKWKGTKDNYDKIKLLQNGVLEYVKEYQQYFSYIGIEKQELDFVDMLLGMFFSERCVVKEEIKQAFWNDDSYDGITTLPNGNLW